MSVESNWLSPRRRILCVTAAPAEVRAIAAGLGADPPAHPWTPSDPGNGWRLIETGVGKVNAAACLATCVGFGPSEEFVINLGICGALPGEAPPPIGSIIIATASVYGDEGVQTPGGFQDMAVFGFPPWPDSTVPTASTGACSGVSADAALVELVRDRLASALNTDVRTGTIATISTCSGTNTAARNLAARTGAIAEAMEGAAIGHALMRLRGSARAFLEIRVVSNTTGNRATQQWNLPGALATLSRIATALRSA